MWRLIFNRKMAFLTPVMGALLLASCTLPKTAEHGVSADNSAPAAHEAATNDKGDWGIHANPALRKGFWFQHVGGEDIKESCQAGAPPHIRLIYNADYRYQVHDFDISAPTGSVALMRHVVFGEETQTLDRLTLNRPFDYWRGIKAVARLDQAAMDALMGKLNKAGAFSGAPDGMQLRGRGYWWTMAACLQGRFFYHAWKLKVATDQPAFTESLFDASNLSLRVRQPDPDRMEIDMSPERPTKAFDFGLRVGENGLDGLPPW